MLRPGTRLGPYEIRAPLGSGGMGEVYRAHDARLGRDVAIKILPSELAGDPVARARFERESRAVAALSHPNILAIHDVGTEAGMAYVVTELLDGSTLRDQLRGPAGTRTAAPLSIRKAVDYALQAAQGLAASHGKGIVHRDIKPENLFVTSDGHVKILDFGLAKVESGLGAAGDANLTVAHDLPTERGTILGTIGYLSPEQARGHGADDRSDIFSLGVVMYEMVAGARPFTGDAAVDVLHRILHDEPPPLTGATDDVPQEMQWIVGKCLVKDPEARYQSVRDLVVDLKNVGRLLDSSPSVSMTARSIARPPRRVDRRLIAGIAIAVLVLAAALVVAIGNRWFAADEGFTNISIERVTASGNVTDAEISPDGKYVAYVVSQSGQQSLWIRQPATSSTLQVVPQAAVSYWGVSFARDGSALYYGQKSTADPNGAFYRVPVLGGTPHKLLSGIDSQPAISPDGKRMAYLRTAFPEQGQSAIMVAGIDGDSPRVLASRRAPEVLSPIFFAAPTWSPDGTEILASLETRDARPRATLLALRSSNGVARAFPHVQWATGGHVAWLPDHSGFVAVAAERAGGQHQLWWVSRRGQAPRAITSDLFDYRKVSVTADSQTLVAVASDNAASIWVAPLDGSGTPRRISAGRYDGLSGVRGGAILYRSLESGRPEIWSMDEGGNDRRQVTTDGASWPSASQDGHTRDAFRIRRFR